MNFLQLVNRTKAECGVSGPQILRIQNASGEIARVVDWVRDAYFMIQGERAWYWLWRQMGANLLTGRQTFDPAAEWDVFALRWSMSSARLDGYHIPMRFYSGPESDTQNGAPSAVTVMPDRTLRFNAPMDRERQFTADYYSTSEALQEDDDTPSMPEQFHMAIVWQATVLYADYEEAGALRMTAQMKLDRMREQMVATEVPPVMMGALA